MGVDIHIKLIRYDEETNFYKELALYHPGIEYHYDEEGNKIIDNPDFTKVRIYDRRNPEMFDGMTNGDEVDGYGIFPHTSIKLNSLEPKLKEEIEKDIKSIGYYDFFEANLSDIRYYLINHPTVVDYDDNEKWATWKEGQPKPQKTNPIKYLYNDICNYAKFADENWDFNPMSVYKIIFYFDR